MAAATGLSITHFSHIFKKSMGESPHQFVLQQRVQYAKELLVSLDLPAVLAGIDRLLDDHTDAEVVRNMNERRKTPQSKFKPVR